MVGRPGNNSFFWNLRGGVSIDKEMWVWTCKMVEHSVFPADAAMVSVCGGGVGNVALLRWNLKIKTWSKYIYDCYNVKINKVCQS